jgi:hypothetical protein
MRKNRWKANRPRVPALGTYNPRFDDYEREKQNWLAHHPKASGQEYMEAMRRIAQECGI